MYVTAGRYEDESLGEVFLRLDELSPASRDGAMTAPFSKAERVHKRKLGQMGKRVLVEEVLLLERMAASLTEQVTDLSVSVSRLLDALATAVSMGLQCGMPLEWFVKKFAHTNFEPSGSTGNGELGLASSPLDAAFRLLQLRYGKPSEG